MMSRRKSGRLYKKIGEKRSGTIHGKRLLNF